jgi:hypothetical protein
MKDVKNGRLLQKGLQHIPQAPAVALPRLTRCTVSASLAHSIQDNNGKINPFSQTVSILRLLCEPFVICLQSFGTEVTKE